MNPLHRTFFAIAFLMLLMVTNGEANETHEIIAAQARLKGNPQRGALLFYKSAAACVKCHQSDSNATPLGPDLTTIKKGTSVSEIVESILDPSKVIRKGYETVTVITDEGKSYSGLVAKETDSELVLRDAANLEKEIVVPKASIDERIVSKKSMMPEKLAELFPEERDLYDLVSYIRDIASGGKARAEQLKPSPEELIVRDDTIGLDHAGILGSMGDRDLKRGGNIYQSHCKNCHGSDGNTPKLPTARAFGTQPLKYGADPYKMLMTLTKGAGLMTPMQHLAPRERYQVIYYIREQLMKPRNPVYQPISDQYLASLPKGERTGEIEQVGERDYGPVLGSQLGGDVNNAISFRLPDEVTVCYDLHRMRLAGVWESGFLDLSQTQHYRQRGERMPQRDGELIPGLTDWQWAFDDEFEIPEEAKPTRGPVNSEWLGYRGHYLHGNRAVLSYRIHDREILETIRTTEMKDVTRFHHSLHIEPGEHSLKLSVARLNVSNHPAGLVSFNKEKVSGRSGSASDHLALVSGTPDGSREQPKNSNKALHVIRGKQARKLDLGTPGRTVNVRFRTTKGGTLVASTPPKGEWKPDGKTLFIRGGRLVYDIGWVAGIVGKTPVNDGKWHTATLVVTKNITKVYLDGKLETQRKEFRREPVSGFVFKVGATATNFGGDFEGDIESVQIYDAAFGPKQIANLLSKKASSVDALLSWKPDAEAKTAETQRKPAEQNGSTVLGPIPANAHLAGAIVLGDTKGLVWNIDKSGRIVLSIPPSDSPRVIEVIRASAGSPQSQQLHEALASARQQEVVDPKTLTSGGPVRWPEELKVKGRLGESINGYALDTIPVPFENPWNAWIRTSALDFFEDGTAVVTTHGGDVYLVSGIDDGLEQVTWKRFAAGLFEPFGVRIVDGRIYVTCRDGLKRLHDYDHNGEADFIEAFWIDDDVSSMFHAYNFDLQTDSAGNFYFAKAGQYTRHHRPGTIMRIPPEGGYAEVVAWGLRTPNGMGKLFDDRFTVSDNQGPWMPAGKISLIEPGGFYGNMPINDEQEEWLKAKHGGELPETFEEPMIWTPQELDNSCGGQVWVDDKRFGPLSGRLIHSSFGKGWLYYLSLQDIDGKTQASIVTLPHQWDAGVMRLRVNPHDGQLYGTGLSGWQGPAGGKDGCLQRLRYSGEETLLVDSVRVVPEGLELEFNFAIDPGSVVSSEAWKIEMWDYLWSRRYGSDQFSVLKPGELGHDRLNVTKVELTGDRMVKLHIPDLAICDQLSLKMNFFDGKGRRFLEHVYMTIHNIPEK